jgi:hypothetical protein
MKALPAQQPRHVPSGQPGRAIAPSAGAALPDVLLALPPPDARLELVQGAGHHLPKRAPDTAADTIAAFIAATDPIASRGRACGGDL